LPKREVSFIVTALSKSPNGYCSIKSSFNDDQLEFDELTGMKIKVILHDYHNNSDEKILVF